MRELGIRQIEAHAAAVCVGRRDGALYVLALHRAPARTLFPNLWEGPGGQVDIGESFPEAAARHVRVEAGIEAIVGPPTSTYVIDPGPLTGADRRIPGIRFLAWVDGTPEPTIDRRQHRDWRWLRADELGSVAWIPGVRAQVEDALRLERDIRGFES